jgi:predicted negative regulator of RcsB-dependent stress response
LALDPNNREAVFALARALYASGQFKAAQQTLEPVLPASENPQVLELWGDLLFKQGASSEALSHWEQSKASGNKSPRLMKKISDKKLYE